MFPIRVYRRLSAARFCLPDLGDLGDHSVTVKIEPVSIDIFHRELPQTPRLLLQRFNDSCSSPTQFLISCVDLRREYPVNCRFKGAFSSAEENDGFIARDSANSSAWV